MQNVKTILAPNGRYAIMAREDPTSPWVQVESVLGKEEADKLAARLDYDGVERHAYIADNGDIEWSEDEVPPS